MNMKVLGLVLCAISMVACFTQSSHAAIPPGGVGGGVTYITFYTFSCPFKGTIHATSNSPQLTLTHLFSSCDLMFAEREAVMQ